MRRSTSVFMVVLAMAFLCGLTLSAWAGRGGVPKPYILQGTTWVGTMTFVGTDGVVEEATDATIQFKTQTDYYFNGTLTASQGLQSPVEANFSGTVGPVIRRELHLTAENMVMSGDVIPKSNGTQAKLGIRGSDVLTGRTFMGMFTKQVNN